MIKDRDHEDELHLEQEGDPGLEKEGRDREGEIDQGQGIKGHVRRIEGRGQGLVIEGLDRGVIGCIPDQGIEDLDLEDEEVDHNQGIKDHDQGQKRNALELDQKRDQDLKKNHIIIKIKKDVKHPELNHIHELSPQ